MQLDLVISTFTFVLGSLVGSFLNVVIYRMPREQSVVKPRSKCPNCGKLVYWYENIPILSWLFLKGRCSSCQSKISIRYPLIELLMGVLAFILAPSDLTTDEIVKFIFYFSIISVFVAHFFIDIEHHLLLDKLNIYLLLIILPYTITYYPISHWLLGGVIGFFGPYIVGELYFKLRGIDGLGGGDIKLFGVLGVIFGPAGVMLNIFLSCALGALVGIILIALKRLDSETPFAFGPFILIVAAVQLFFPEFVNQLNPFVIR